MPGRSIVREEDARHASVRNETRDTENYDKARSKSRLASPLLSPYHVQVFSKTLHNLIMVAEWGGR